MNIAFYAPLKAPDDAVPSGDRLIARMLWAALEQGGHDLRLMSRLRSFDRDGDPGRQAKLRAVGQRSAARIVRRLSVADWRPDVWLTYHLYHKAPDWIGPEVAARLGLPYCLAEASSSPRQATGAWAEGHAAVSSALSQARLVLSVNPKDLAGIAPLVGSECRIVSVPPFIDGAPFRQARLRRESLRRDLGHRLGLAADVPWLVCVGMMRPGDKQRSFALLADALARLGERRWNLLAIGDGTARGVITAGFTPVADRVRWLGLRDTAEVAEIMAASDLFVWPAINEAIGMVFIEAAMAGLPVVAADRPGIAQIVADGETGRLTAEGDTGAFAAEVATYIADGDLRRRTGERAALRANAQFDLRTAGKQVCSALEGLAS